MKTKADFQAKTAAEISNYPRAAQLYKAQDPTLLAKLDSMAAMLAMFSAEQDVAAAEPFTKARDATVLADATAKGILPFGTPARMSMTVENTNAVPFTIASGRRVLDKQGRVYVVEVGTTVPANDSAEVTIVQRSERKFDHTVTVSQPFYMIEVPAPEAGRHMAEVLVEDEDGNEFTYRPEYVNTLPGDRVFHLQSDENQRLFVEFGAASVAGYQPGAGEVFTITVIETEGGVTLDAGSRFTFEYTGGPEEGGVRLSLDSVLSPGAAPPDINTLREFTRFPSIYDTNAVYLGNFDFLVRRKLAPFRFLSIWNEQVEEAVRGPSVDNINTLFVAAMKDGVDDADLRAQIRSVILAADDSYRVADVEVVETEIPVDIVARVPAVYDFAQVEQQIRELILDRYGRDSDFAKAGQNRVLYKRIYRLLTDNVDALKGEIADLEVEVTDPDVNIKPEQYRYVSADSLTITVEQAL